MKEANGPTTGIAFALASLLFVWGVPLGGFVDQDRPSEITRSWDAHGAGQSVGRSLGLNDSGDSGQAPLDEVAGEGQ